MPDILIRGYKAKEQIEEIIQEARYAMNNSMVGSGLEIIELPAHGDLISKDATIDAILDEPDEESYPCVFAQIVEAQIVIVPASEEAIND